MENILSTTMPGTAARGAPPWTVSQPRPAPLDIPLSAAARVEILAGLRRPQKTIHPKYFYDARGSQLFEAICECPEYYLPRAELAALRLNLPEIRTALTAGEGGQRGLVFIEPGAGASTKIRVLLDQILARAYVPVDICQPMVRRSAASLRAAYPDLEVVPVWADFTRPFPVPELRASRAGSRRIVFFPGSTIGNYEPAEAVGLLERFRAVAGPGGGLLVGVDLPKSPAILLPAYNDPGGVTAMFNLNLLYRLNRECGAEFRPELFAHRAVWDEERHRIEMRLISRRKHRVRIGPAEIRFDEGEYILTEYSHKPSREEFAALAAEAGLVVKGFWTDPRHLFSVQYLEVRGRAGDHAAS